MTHLQKGRWQMAIQDRNLSVGTKLYARYKGQTYTCELVETEQGPRYRLAEGREFKSPAAAGAAVMGEGRTCNGWAFWTVGDGATATGPVRSARGGPASVRRVDGAPGAQAHEAYAGREAVGAGGGGRRAGVG